MACLYLFFCVCSLYFQAAPARLSKEHKRFPLSSPLRRRSTRMALWWLMGQKSFPKRLRGSSGQGYQAKSKVSKPRVQKRVVCVRKGSQVHRSVGQKIQSRVEDDPVKSKRVSRALGEFHAAIVSLWSQYQILLCGQIKVNSTQGYLRRPSL